MQSSDLRDGEGNHVSVRERDRQDVSSAVEFTAPEPVFFPASENQRALLGHFAGAAQLDKRRFYNGSQGHAGSLGTTCPGNR